MTIATQFYDWGRWAHWTACEDSYEPGAPMGVGATQPEAVADLKQQLEER